MTKTLAELIAALPESAALVGNPDTRITAPVTESDAEIQPGGVFVARRGLSVDGHTFIPRAIERGAAVVVGENDLRDLPVPYVRVGNAQEATGYLAAAYHDYPSRHLTLMGVTGTDGKTTTSTLLHSILKVATDGKAGLISTVSADLGGAEVDTGLHVTTPGAPQVQALLAQMRANGLTHVVLEMTSHGLAQGRLNGVEIDGAVLTNVTHEHLDYHGTFENYRAAKGRMFDMLARTFRKRSQSKISVVNADDPSAGFFAAFAADRVLRYGLEHEVDFRAVDVTYGTDATRFTVIERGSPIRAHIETALVGAFNVYNVLAAISAARGLKIPVAAVKQGILNVRGVPGRMERIDEGQPFIALVDFAHTPNALKRALEAARTMLAPGQRLIAVFGSAGLRDREKRRLMAETAACSADFSIFTAEDPRTESLDGILAVMAQAAVSQGAVEGETFIRVPDRGAALYRACQMARPGDLVIACGKGHEQSMCFGTVEYAWDDRAALRAALRGEPLRTLPTAT